MSSPRVVAAPVRVSLSERLQTVTEALAAARTRQDVFTVVLTPALQALEAVAGAVLLADETGERLDLAATQGYEEDAQTLWQDGPLDGNVPAGDALERHEALFFEQEGDLVRVYPELEARTGGLAAVATAVLPMFLDGSPLGGIILDFKEPHEFSDEEKRFLRTLAAQCALALGRVRLLASLQAQVQARARESDEARSRAEVLTALGEALQAARSPEDVAALALKPLGEALDASSAVVVRLEDGLIRVPTVWGEVLPAMAALRTWWVPLEETPLLAECARTGEAGYYADYNAARGGLAGLPTLAFAAEPIRTPEGGVAGFLCVWRPPQGDSWLQGERDLLRRAAGTLGLALERAANVAQLEAAKSTAEVLARLGDALQAASSPEEVARLALERLGPALEAVGMNIVRLEGDHIQGMNFWGEVPASIRTFMTQPGRKLADTPNLLHVARTRQPLYFGDDHATGGPVPGLPSLAEAISPIVTPGGLLVGFVVTWRPAGLEPLSEGGRDLLRRAAATLGLALERAATTRQLEEERAALDAFVAYKEAVGGQSDVPTLARQAAQVVRANLEHVSVAYYELEGGLWKARVWSGDVAPEVLAQITAGIPQDAPNFAQAARSGEPHFVDGWNAAANGLPSAERYGAAGLIPLVLGGETRSLFTVGIHEARAWTEREKALVRAVARGLAVTLERTETTRQLAENARAQEAFVAFTEAVGTETDLLAVVRQAIVVLRDRFHDGTTAYYTRDGDLWKARAWSEDMSAALIGTVAAGLPGSTPLIRHALEAGTAVFTEAWDAERERIEHTEEYGTAAAYPLTVNGEVNHLLLFGLKDTPQWTERDRALIRAVGRGLTLALERAEQTRRLEVQNAELDARTRALEGFAALTQDLTAQDDPRAFVRRAQEVVLSLLSPGYARYFEPEEGRWRYRVQVGDDGNAALQAHIEAGLPFGSTPSLDAPWTTRQPLYQDNYARGRDTPAEMVRHVNATASLPVLRHGEVVGVFAVVLFEARSWTPTDRVVLETVVRSLGGALERAEATRDLTTTQLRLRAVVDHAPLVLFALDRQGTFTLSEGRGLAGLGLTPGQAVGHSAYELYQGVPELLDDLRLALGGQEVHQTRRIADRVFESWTIPVQDAAGAVTDLVGVSMDVTERQQAEEDLARRNEELRRSNAELEQFAYVASHDLQAPIRAVTSFAGVIDRRYGSQLDERGRLYLQQIVEGGEHMKRLVDDLLAFSRVHTERRDLSPTNSQAVFDIVVGRLRPEIRARGAGVTRGDLPVVLADAPQLDQLLQNLVSNGLKYQREGVIPQVHVWAERDGELWRFAVRDNGIGIEPQYFERIFVIFQRLHGREEYEGTGIGLAVCKKIVERHGGKLWLESIPGQGSTFFFTLPAT